MDKKTKSEYINKTKYGFSEYIALIVCLIVGVFMIMVVFSSLNPTDGIDESSTGEYTVIDTFISDGASDNEKNTSGELVDLSSDDISDDVSVNESLYEVVTVNNEDVYKGDLILVDKKNVYKFIDETPVVKVSSMKIKGKYNLGWGTEKLFAKTIEAANLFLGDFYDATGISNVTMINGYLTLEDQKKAYENYIKSVSPEDAEKWGVKPGASDHHTGLSFNLTLIPQQGKLGEGDYLWLEQEAYKYGFILRYPREKQDITNVIDDNLYRYVGVPHAEYMYKNNMCLEEYLIYLRETTYYSPLKFLSNDKEYFIYYFPADTSSDVTEIKVPSGFSYFYSGNNIDGFIVTAYIEK